MSRRPIRWRRFQSTRPMRGETAAAPGAGAWRSHFNPLAPCGARRGRRYSRCFQRISIHSPHAGRDGDLIPQPVGLVDISIHSPHAGRDNRDQRPREEYEISIHSPHAGRDQGQHIPYPQADDFNPLAPCGARRAAACPSWGTSYFNPLAPCGARRPQWLVAEGRPGISIHSPHAGRDSACFAMV